MVAGPVHNLGLQHIENVNGVVVRGMDIDPKKIVCYAMLRSLSIFLTLDTLVSSSSAILLSE